MVTTRKCGTCGAVLPEGAPTGQCPECLLQLGLNAATDDGTNAMRAPCRPLLRYFGDYELLEEIARGGMGVVYKARQLSLNRTVAVKMILAGHFAGKESVQRFRAEAEAAASLRHPNIVAIHEVGEHEGQQYFSMDYIEGRNLAEAVRDNPMSARHAAACIQTIAQTIQYAHDRGILHRDLKPSNVLLDIFDAPHITDFGLAKRLTPTSDFGPRLSDLTLSGQVLGSPNYMPPEQASGKRGQLGPASDVYSLGAILHHLLTGRAPFASESVTDTLQQVLHNEPVSPRLLNPSVPVDLETICLKCLQKELTRRYRTATELADELGSFLRDEPILARPVGLADKTWRWCRRKPALATLGGIAMVLFLIVAIGAPVTVLRTERARAEADHARSGAENARSDAERNLYAAEMNLASHAVRDGAVVHARELLNHHRPKPGAADLRGFEWRYLWRATGQGEVVRTLEGLPRILDTPAKLVRVGDTLYNLDDNGNELRAWNMTDWTTLPSRLPSHPTFDGWLWHPQQETALAVDNTNRTLTLYHLPGFQKGQIIPSRGPVTQSAISPDRRLLAVCCQDGDKQRVSVWDLMENAERAVPGEYSAPVCLLKFSGDGTILAIPSADGVISLWDVATSKRLPGPPKFEALTTFVQFTPVGSRFAYWNEISDVLHLWDPIARKSSSVEQCDLNRRFRFSPDGELVAMASGDVVKIFEMKSAHRVGELRGHQAEPRSLVFSPDGRLLATASWDRTARLWDLKTERELATLGGHDDSVYDVTFSADGQQLITISANGTAKVWDVPAVLGRNLLFKTSTYNNWLRMSADESLLALADETGTIHIWDRLNHRETHSLWTGGHEDTFGLTFDPRGHQLAWASRTTLGVFDPGSGRTNTIQIEGNQSAYEGIRFSPNSQEIMFGSNTNVMLCELPLLQLRSFARCDEEVDSIAYSPDGTLLAFGYFGGGVSLWERRSGRKLSAEQAHSEVTVTVEFSRDGKWLASCGTMTIQLWHVQRNGLKRFGKPLIGHAGYVPSIAFSPDGTRLVSASSDRTLKIWDTAEGIELATLYGHQARVWGVAFSKDGRRIYSTGTDGDVRVWEAPPLAEIDSFSK